MAQPRSLSCSWRGIYGAASHRIRDLRRSLAARSALDRETMVRSSFSIPRIADAKRSPTRLDQQQRQNARKVTRRKRCKAWRFVGPQVFEIIGAPHAACDAPAYTRLLAREACGR